MKIRVEKYSPKWSEKHYEFATRNFGERRKRRNSDYIYWKFRGNEGQKLNTFLLAVNEEDDVIGQLGLIPTSLWVNDKSYEAYWACDLMVDPNFRGAGVARLLYDHACSINLVFGSKPSPKASTSMRKFGFKTINGPRMVFIHSNVIDTMNWVLQKLNIHLKLKLTNPVIYVAKVFRFVIGKSIKELSLSDSIEVVLNNEERLQKFNFLMRFNRSEDFLKWRFSPYKDYQKTIKSISTGKSFVLFHQDNNGSIYVGDFFFNNIKDQFVLLFELILRMSNSKGIYIYFNVWNEKKIIPFLLTGFWIKPGQIDVIYCDYENRIDQNDFLQKKLKYNYFDSDERL